MSRNGCKSTRPRLPLLAGGELLGNDRREVERHVIGCFACRHHLESLRNSLHILHVAAESTPIRPDTPSLWPALSRQIRESRRPGPVSWTSRYAWPLVGMAATFALAVGTLFAARPVPPRRSIATVVHKSTTVVHTPPKFVQNDAPADSDDSADPDPAPVSPRRSRSNPYRNFVDPLEAQPTH